jgi:capsular polysaccharide biosynthesis protein
MTISHLLTKFRVYWYLIILLPAIFTAFGFSSFVNKSSYSPAISVGITYNNADYLKTSSENWDRQLNSVSEYLTNRFKSIEVQKKIIDKMGYSDASISAKKPFYEITNQNAGFVSISANLNTKDEANQFLSTIKSVYQEIIETEKSANEIDSYKVKPMDKFLESIVETKTPIQFRIMPTIFGLVLAILIVAVLPAKSESKS